ncbi:xanthine dehydrogenase family protein molybdopterin-binding subunit [Rhodococcus jostii]|uniref:Xanthine dehydrogenase, molybdenum binding subunit apoprotein n=1 Tax=Rhodococcus jostii TaxID=132919 RepID=A0A1H4IS30_RHOJO|nr:xanthine dehydrogenase family protein molybdopterin-binding subunit [Rhodococcus jostii]SEB36859.1 xanthine dehydrogenase, molybdenum binding subunit apoprotein [Rhodococcus jostii]
MSAVETGRPSRYVGARVKRVEDPRFLTGRGKYIDDISLPGLLHAAFVRSPLPHATILSIDTDAALEVPGVLAVYTAADFADEILPITAVIPRPEGKPVSQPALAVDNVRYLGEAVAIVIAESRYLAEDGAELVEVDYDPLPTVLDATYALSEDAPRLHAELESNSAGRVEETYGDIDAAFGGAYRVFTKNFHTGRLGGAPLENRAVMADYDPASDRLTMWCSSQMPYIIRTAVAPLLKIPEGRFRLISPDVGGGFGLKASMYPEDIAIPAASRKIGRPVKWVEDRFENLAASNHAREVACTMDIAVKEDGEFVGFRGTWVADGGAYTTYPNTSLVNSIPAGKCMTGVYDVQNVNYVADGALTNKCPSGAIRGTGLAVGQTVRETLVDDIARAMQIDPVALRLRNVIPSEPYRTAFGQNYDGGSYRESIELAQKEIGYEEFRSRQLDLRKQGRYIGIGFSAIVEPSAPGTDLAAAIGVPVASQDQASVVVEPDGSVTVTTGMHSHGQGHETTFAQVVADELGVRLEDVRVRFGDTDQAQWGMGTWASRSAVIATGALTRAAIEIKGKLQKLAGTILEASPDDIEIYNGIASVKGAPQVAVPLSAVTGFGYFAGYARPEAETVLTATRSYDPPETYSNGCTVVVVEVDVETGIVKIERLLAVEDCGVVLNPMIVDGQVCGGLAQGLGMALLEEMVYDDDGQFLSGSLMDYLYPTSMDVPNIEIHHIETPSAVTTSGVKGMGEGGTIVVPAAIINAVADALSPFGVSIDRTPVTPSYLRDLLRDKQPEVVTET